ncbi:MAG: hypothetical protein P8X57_15095 [Cyclobacteriaceae bacterium]
MKLLGGINSQTDSFLLSAPKREFIYVGHALIQYFIAAIRAGIFDQEKEHLQILKSIAESIDEDFDGLISNLFE